MSITELKTNLHATIESIDDEQLLAGYLRLLLKEINAQEDYTLTPEEEAAINEAEVELEAGKGMPNDVVKEKFRKKYPHIVKWE